VLPCAPLKLFLTATEEERARRRHRDETAAARPAAVDEVAADLARRDLLDRSRVTSPLMAADDALTVDSTGRSVEEVVDELVVLAEERFARAAEA
jgi:cytidylate kinase